MYHQSNLQIAPNLGYDNVIDSLRSWDEERLVFAFIVPPTFALPFTTNKIRAFEWSSSAVQELFMPVSVDRWSIYAIWRKRYQILFNSFLSDTLYRSNVQEALLIINQYDLQKKRVSGRFSFRAIGSIGGEVVQIREGVFDNVRLYTENR